MLLTIKVRRMWGAKTKNKAVDLWRTKAMLIDPRKTTLTIIYSTTSKTSKTEKTSEIQALNIKTDEPNQSITLDLAEAQNAVQSKEDIRTMEQNRETTKLSLLEAFNTIFPPKD
jgi:hypothetical protein